MNSFNILGYKSVLISKTIVPIFFAIKLLFDIILAHIVLLIGAGKTWPISHVKQWCLVI